MAIGFNLSNKIGGAGGAEVYIDNVKTSASEVRLLTIENQFINLTLEDLPYDFNAGAAVVLNNEIHLLGSTTTGNHTKHVKFNGTEWVTVSTLPYDFRRGAAVVLNNEIHLLGGYGNETKHIKFNGTEWVTVSTLPYNFYDGSAVVFNNEIHLLGSSTTGNQTKHVKFNGTEWVTVSTLPYNFYNGAAVVLNNEIHILGSENTGNQTKHVKFDGTTWSFASYLPYNFRSGSAVVFNNELHILGTATGTTEGPFGKSHFKYTGTAVSGLYWFEVSTLINNFYNGAAVVYNNEICLIGGSNQLNKFYAIKDINKIVSSIVQ